MCGNKFLIQSFESANITWYSSSPSKQRANVAACKFLWLGSPCSPLRYVLVNQVELTQLFIWQLTLIFAIYFSWFSVWEETSATINQVGTPVSLFVQSCISQNDFFLWFRFAQRLGLGVPVPLSLWGATGYTEIKGDAINFFL